MVTLGIGIFLVGLICFLSGYLIFALFCNFVFRALTRPLQVPATYKVESRRDMIMTYIIMFSIVMTYLGTIPLLITYAVGVLQHILERRAAARGETVSDLPRIPHVTLGELMIMMFSFACFPLMASAIVDWAFTLAHEKDVLAAKPYVAIAALVVGIFIFPLCFVSAMHRLNGNRVPPGRTRALFLFIYPYIFLSIQVAMVGLIPAGIMWLDMKEEPKAFTMFIILYALTWVVLVAGWYLARQGKREAAAALEAATQQKMLVTENSTMV